MSVISTIGFNQQQMINDILELHCPEGIELDPTYSKGVFYKSGEVKQPLLKYDLFPQTDDTIEASADKLPLSESSIKSIMFDPPFIVGHTKDKPTGIIGQRFHGFRYIRDLWEWYDLCLAEHFRILKKRWCPYI